MSDKKIIRDKLIQKFSLCSTRPQAIELLGISMLSAKPCLSPGKFNELENLGPCTSVSVDSTLCHVYAEGH